MEKWMDQAKKLLGFDRQIIAIEGCVIYDGSFFPFPSPAAMSAFHAIDHILGVVGWVKNMNGVV